MEKRKVRILTVIVILTIGLLAYLLYRATHTGPRGGRVIGAITGKPIENAVVVYVWRLSGFLEVVGGSLVCHYETTTDKDGRYFIPNQQVKRDTIFNIGLYPESVIIYKDNYAVYTVWGRYDKPLVGKSFGYPRKNQEYSKKDNLVKLYPWKSGELHYRHISWIRSSDCYGKSVLLRKELEAEEKRADEEGIVW